MSEVVRCRRKLSEILRDDFALVEIDSVEALLRPSEEDSACFLQEPRLRIAHHLDLKPDILIYDPRFETVAFVQIVPNGRKLKDKVEDYLAEAAYVRRLMAERAKRKHRVPSVELVLVSMKETLQAKIHMALQELIRKSDVLHLIGVSEICCRPGDDLEEASLRRAFPWLLRSTGSWFEGLATAGSGNRLEKLTLENFRVAGKRLLDLGASATRLHLIHGHNGTGKSALCESIELLRTGRIERLVGELDYDKILRHSGSSTARIHLQCSDTSLSEILTVGAEDNWKSVNEAQHPASFRLDQTVMDKLTRPENRGHRASTFLEAFFPGDAEISKRYYAELEDVRGTLAALSEQTREEWGLPAPQNLQEAGISSLKSKLEAELGWLSKESPQRAPESASYTELLPLPLEELRALTPFSSELEARCNGWADDALDGSAAERSISEINRLLASLDQRLSSRLREARKILEDLGDWTADPSITLSQGYEQALNGWLESVAEADLLKRQIQISETLSRAEDLGWRRVLDDLPLPAIEAEMLGRLNESWQRAVERRDRLHQEVTQGARNHVESQVGEIPAAGSARFLSPGERATLDRVGPWLGLPQLGLKVQEMLYENKVQNVEAGLTLGSGKWSTELQARLTDLEQAVERLPRVRPDLPDKARKLLTSLQKLSATREELEETFIQKIFGDAEDLGKALNELMALFTPARWAYEDMRIQLSHGKDPEIQMQVGDSAGEGFDVDTRFNTAELNLFTFALFLLCAPRQENPLNLLVFDDPLQNMDELTVSTLARGLGKVSRIWPDSCSALMLFHGEDDVERFRRELPAAVYCLPWLNPTNSGEISIQRDPKLSTDGRKRLTPNLWDLEQL